MKVRDEETEVVNNTSLVLFVTVIDVRRNNNITTKKN